MTKARISALIVLLVGIGLGFFVYTTEVSPQSNFPFRLGLDLSGGSLLTYRADISGVSQGEIESSMETLKEVVERRVSSANVAGALGVSDPAVQTEVSVLGGETEHRLIVELPGVTDLEQATRFIGETPLLEFKLRAESLQVTSDTEGATASYTDTGLTGRFLQRARLEFGQGGHLGGGANAPTVVLEFNTEGAERFRQITGENIGRILAIFLDDEAITEPVIQSEIPDGTAVITGRFTPEEARDLVRNLNFGALPTPIELVGTETIGPTLGEEIASSGVTAGIWGLALVALFLILWYRLPGLVAALSLAVYVVIMLALFKLIPVTLTAAGIAGFVLSIGLAVDANVLIFERLKEEIRNGVPLREAIDAGFARAWLPIRDGNMTSLLIALILFFATTSLVRGFAVTLGLGVVVSVLTAVTATRTFLRAVAPEKENVLFRSGFRS